jgi:hypothetical protein
MWKQKEHMAKLEENLTRNSSGTEQPAQITPSNARYPGPSPMNNNQERLPYTALEIHHHMLLDKKQKINLATWLGKHEGDVACKVT